MKKYVLFIIAALIVLMLPACDTGEPETDSETITNEITNPVKTTEESTESREEPNSRVNKNDPDFYVMYTKDEVDFTDAPKAYIDIYRWGTDYTPKAYAQAVFKEGDGFYIRMECEETDPRAVNTNYNDPIYEDSCLEFFVIYMPHLSGKYINTEMNANGAYLCYFCDSMADNVTIDTVTNSMPVVTSFKTKTSWGVNLYVPLGLIEDAYGSADISKGSKILANFYKCGDKTAVSHYGSWNEVINENPNFHLPEYFAEIEIK
ncbi:MAG: carbohydrate-binding family 9-like protein [Eubacteriales bacterium]|jgi:hypothetical protein|nr:carbohydrate-binding family 9-like protein [Eubacteriales bacterium]